MGSRHDMYSNVHKGLRRTLCALLADAGLADESPAELAQLASRWHAIAALLSAHHHHEDTFIGPHLARLVPTLFAEMERDHHALDGEAQALTASAHALTLSPPAALPVGARSFYRQLASFVGHYLSHMANEEGPYLQALQQAYSDEQLAAIEGELLASVAPDTMGAFLSEMLPAMSPGERFAMLDDMRRHAPPPVFGGVCQLAEGALRGQDWRVLSARLSQAQSAAAHV